MSIGSNPLQREGDADLANLGMAVLSPVTQVGWPYPEERQIMPVHLFAPSTTGTGKNITSLVALGTVTASGDAMVQVEFRLSNLFPADTTFDVVVEHTDANDVKIQENYWVSDAKRLARDTVYGGTVPPIHVTSGEKLVLMVKSSSGRDTSVAFTINWIDVTPSNAMRPDVPAMVKEPTVFVVYGHDPGIVTNVESLLSRIGCKPLLFPRIPKRGSETNIELLERTMPRANAVVAVLTPDDEGRKRDAANVTSEPLERRARQNVLIEAGYAVISRRHQAIIVAIGGVSIPSDFDGINRVQAATWSRETEHELARRLHAMFESAVDLSQV